MRLSKLLFKTERQAPADSEIISHKLLSRAGMIKKVASGIYSYTPLGLRVLRKIENIIREEMDAAGAQELLMPALQPAELWMKTGRWQQYGAEMMRLKDRNDRDFCLGPTHEELITTLVSSDVKSYKQLPLNVYQIQVKFRDEMRPRFGLMRVREFHMKDAYSFHESEESLEETYEQMKETYSRIISRCEVPFRAVQSGSGLIGGSVSHEYMVLATTGEEAVAYCDTCDYAANVEVATAKRVKGKNEQPNELEEVETPGKKKVEDVAQFLNMDKSRLVKTLIYNTAKGRAAVLIMGDRDVNNSKLATVLGEEPQMLAPEEFDEKLPFGFTGPVGLEMPIFADIDVENSGNVVTGANKKNVHFLNVNPGRDFKVDKYEDLITVREGDACPDCDGSLKIARGIEVGNIFQLGKKYSNALNANYTDENGQQKPFIMGCYGIGVGRLMAAVAEINNDEHGIIWPVSVAPYQVVVIPIQADNRHQLEWAERIYGDLKAEGLEVLLDDRHERPGIKFSDADLIGIPVHVVIGKRITENQAEIKIRKNNERDIINVTDVKNKVLHILMKELT